MTRMLPSAQPLPAAASSAAHRRAAAGAMTSIVLLALNLRTLVASLPPLLSDVRADLGLSGFAAGLLTTLPVLAFGAFAPLAPRLTRRVSIERVLVGCALLTAVAAGLRGAGGWPPLYLGCALAGLAVALAQAVLPVFIRLRHPEMTGLLTGAYSMSLTLGAALAAALAVPLEDALGSWEASLAAWALPALLAALVWLPAALRPGHDGQRPAVAGAVAQPARVEREPVHGRAVDGVLRRRWRGSRACSRTRGFSRGRGGRAAGARARSSSSCRRSSCRCWRRAAATRSACCSRSCGFRPPGVIGLLARAGRRAAVDGACSASARAARSGSRLILPVLRGGDAPSVAVADRDVAVRRLHRRGDGAVAARRRARRLAETGPSPLIVLAAICAAGAGAGAARRARREAGGTSVMETQVAIVGAGPAGLLLAHLLERAGIESVVLELRSREYVEGRVRAGVLEQGTVDVLDGGRRRGPPAPRGDGPPRARAALRRPRPPDRRSRSSTGGRTITVYGQQEVVKDLIAARAGRGRRAALRGRRDVAVEGVDGERPAVRFSHEGAEASCAATSSRAATASTASRRPAIASALRGLRARVPVRLARDPRPRRAVLARS